MGGLPALVAPPSPPKKPSLPKKAIFYTLRPAQVNFDAIVRLFRYCNRCKLDQYCSTLPRLKRLILSGVGQDEVEHLTAISSLHFPWFRCTGIFEFPRGGTL